MSPGRISRRICAERLVWIERMLEEIRSLPLGEREAFLADPRNPAAAESYLRRSLEAVLDLGRHLLAKGFGEPVTEYKDIARGCREKGILSGGEAEVLMRFAGYRNRMVHFYHEISAEELWGICTSQLGDIERVAGACRDWLQAHPELLDETL